MARNLPTGDDADQGIPVAPACWRCEKRADDWARVCRTCWEREFGDIWWHGPGETPPRTLLSAQDGAVVVLLLTAGLVILAVLATMFARGGM